MREKMAICIINSATTPVSVNSFMHNKRSCSTGLLMTVHYRTATQHNGLSYYT